MQDTATHHSRFASFAFFTDNTASRSCIIVARSEHIRAAISLTLYQPSSIPAEARRDTSHLEVSRRCDSLCPIPRKDPATRHMRIRLPRFPSYTSFFLHLTTTLGNYQHKHHTLSPCHGGRSLLSLSRLVFHLHMASRNLSLLIDREMASCNLSHRHQRLLPLRSSQRERVLAAASPTWTSSARVFARPTGALIVCTCEFAYNAL